MGEENGHPSPERNGRWRRGMARPFSGPWSKWPVRCLKWLEWRDGTRQVSREATNTILITVASTRILGGFILFNTTQSDENPCNGAFASIWLRAGDNAQ